MSDRRLHWFEDFVPGTTVTAGTISFDEAEIIAFARRYDPQPFHIDPVAAAGSFYGGIIASGWHTFSKIIRTITDYTLGHDGCPGFIVSPGFEDLRWIKPVRPGDVLTVTIEVISATASETRPDRGLIKQRFSAANATGEVVCSVLGKAFIGKRGQQ
ncbi:MaoC family dehydratase [Oleomonas cavernae]|uniref:MaoC family dehydratase n=1 Tax=Oleomonas cavernae TaxID=2320859 RepID=A0A418W9N4_9PROT|nr:MaoC family dehydratase [Oleomonas cavernae]RJF86727.1 MaoC family dehydratase [Oleomonas cavernae]